MILDQSQQLAVQWLILEPFICRTAANGMVSDVANIWLALIGAPGV